MGQSNISNQSIHLTIWGKKATPATGLPECPERRVADIRHPEVPGSDVWDECPQVFVPRVDNNPKDHNNTCNTCNT